MDQRKQNLSKVRPFKNEILIEFHVYLYFLQFLTGYKPESMTELASLNSEENLLESDISLMSTPPDPLKGQSEFFVQMREYLLSQQESLRKNLERLKEKAEDAQSSSTGNKAKIPSHSNTSTLPLHDPSSVLAKHNKRFSPEPMNQQHWE